MARKQKNIVDAFMFREAKKSVDSLTKPQPKPATENNQSQQTQKQNVSKDRVERSRNNNITTSRHEHDSTNIVSVTQHKHDDVGDKAAIEQANGSKISEMIQAKKTGLYQDDTIKAPSIKERSKKLPQISLSKAQTDIYLWLKDRKDIGQFNKPEIQKSLSMPYGTVRQAIRKLENTGIVEISYDNCQKIHEYEFNEHINVKLQQDRDPITGKPQVHSANITPSLISSSSLNNNTTTIENFHSDPEIQYWRQQGVTEKQVFTWMNEAGISSPLDMICYLQWSAFDMREIDGNNHEKEKKIKSPAAWFRKILLKNSAYLKPSNYESYEDIELKKEKENVSKVKKLAEEKRRIREEKRQAHIDLQFESMLEEKGDMFEKCEHKIGDFALKRPQSLTYEKAMRTAFEKLYFS